jgi:hypothetical protein
MVSPARRTDLAGVLPTEREAPCSVALAPAKVLMGEPWPLLLVALRPFLPTQTVLNSPL